MQQIQSTSTMDFKQNMHFVEGSNVKSVLRTALSIKKRNTEWKKAIDTIRTHFLISEFSQAPEPELMKWTIDRGKLTKINDVGLDFFVQLGTEVKPLERLDGSILSDSL